MNGSGMSRCSAGLVFLLLLAAGNVSGFPLNSKDAPESREDLMTIQDALREALPEARAATVCIDLGEGSGTGVIVSEDGLVMTAAHVTAGVGKKLTVILPDGTELEAESLGLKADTDAALVRILEEGKYPFVELNRTGDTELGDWVFSLGHSGGFDKERGAVLRLARLVRVANKTIQTDGTLIGGDSGGPLFDMEGRLIGIHSRVGPQLPVNMHVPIREFLDSFERMKESEFIGEGPFARRPEKGKGFLGVATEATEGGVRILRVGKGSPAEKAGLLAGDVIESLNGTGLGSREDLQEVLAELAPGAELELKIMRDDEDETIVLELGER